MIRWSIIIVQELSLALFPDFTQTVCAGGGEDWRLCSCSHKNYVKIKIILGDILETGVIS